jgi:Tol biopolymer transport system component/predicted Ser/Thr protein kinase
MGEVYKARDTRLDRIVAVKVSQAQFSERFEREARAVASLNHSSICQLYDVGPDYLVMEYIEGTPLKGPLPLDQALRCAAQICDALDAAHGKGITHRDLKPANILLTKSGIKLLDFGLAKIGPAATPTSESTLTMALTGKNEIVGTLYYMSPEQLQSQATGEEIDGRSDIFSFGIVLYEMLTGKRAFAGASPASVIAAIMERPAPSIADIAPPALDRVLKKCLAKNRDARWQTARDLKDELDWIATASGETPTAPNRVAVRRPLTGTIASGVLALGLAGALWNWAPWRQRSADAPMSQFAILPPEKASFSDNLAISPDGRQIVFAANTGQNASLWLRPLDSLTARPLPGTEDAVEPFWSPDSRSIGFFARGKLKKIDLAGGPAQILADASLPRGGTWNPSGVMVFRPRIGALYSMPANGGEATPLAHLDRLYPRTPSFLPDGRHFLFSADGDQNDVYVGSLDSKDVKQVLHRGLAIGYSAPGYLLFSRESALMAQAFDAGNLSTSGEPFVIAENAGAASVSANRTLVFTPPIANQTHLVWVDRSGKQISEAAPPGDYSDVALSPDGKHVAFNGSDFAGFKVWLRDLERGITSRFTFSSHIANIPVWSPSGDTVAFATSEGGGGLLNVGQRRSNMIDSESVLLQLDALPLMFPTDWSSDGRYFTYFRTGAKTQLDQWALPMFGDHKPFPYANSPSNESQGQFSPDGKWMAYVSNQSGIDEIYVASFPARGGLRLVSTGGGDRPRWRRDGRELFYAAPDRKLMAVSVKTGSTFEAGTPHALFEIKVPISQRNRQIYSVSADGQRFLLTAPLETPPEPLTLIQNWTAGLKK